MTRIVPGRSMSCTHTDVLFCSHRIVLQPRQEQQISPHGYTKFCRVRTPRWAGRKVSLAAQCSLQRLQRAARVDGAGALAGGPPGGGEGAGLVPLPEQPAGDRRRHRRPHHPVLEHLHRRAAQQHRHRVSGALGCGVRVCPCRNPALSQSQLAHPVKADQLYEMTVMATLHKCRARLFPLFPLQSDSTPLHCDTQFN